MKKRTFLRIGVFTVLLIVALISLRELRNSGGSGTPTQSINNVFGDAELTQQAFLTQQSAIQTALPTATLAPYSNSTSVFGTPKNGDGCGTDCMWSEQCVSGQFTLAETTDTDGYGVTRVRPGFCEPIDFAMWYIRPSNPFAGMPCAANDRSCVWSSDCVTDTRFSVAPVLNGLAKVVRDSCQVVP